MIKSLMLETWKHGDLRTDRKVEYWDGDSELFLGAMDSTTSQFRF